MTAWARAGLGAALLALGARPAAGDPAVRVTLSVDPCVQAGTAEIERLFFLELGSARPEAPAGREGPPTAHVEVTCAADLLELRVHDALTGKQVSRRIAPGNAGRERLIALAAVELLVSSWIELAAGDPPAAVGDPALGRARRDARALVASRLRPPARRWDTTASVIAGAGAGGVTRAGAGVRLQRDAPGWGWSAELGGWTGSRRVSLGTVQATGLGGALAAHLAGRSGPALLHAGAGVQLELVSLDGEPAPGSGASADQVAGAVAGPFARAGALLHTGDLALSLVLDAGYHLAGVRALIDGRPSTSIDGAWLAGSAGVGWSW